MVYNQNHTYFKGFCDIDYANPSSLKGALEMNGVEHQEDVSQW